MVSDAGSGTAQAAAPVPPSRPKRADARRNYDKLIAAAEAAFAQSGADASLDGIAKAAGVGPGTLYRNFPTRRALLEAVYAERISELCVAGPGIARQYPPRQALAEWLQQVAAHTTLYRGLKDVLMSEAADDGEAADFSWCAAQMRATCATLLDAARQTGPLPDVEPNDLLRLMHGVVLSTEHVPAAQRARATQRQLDLALSWLR